MALVAHIYNPQNQPKEELIQNFVIRQKEFKTLFEDISKAKMKTPEQHYLIQGQRGMGKTTLIMRLYYEIQNSNKLNKWLVPVLFSEEQYAIRKLYKLWEHIAIYLEDHDLAFGGLFDRMDEKIDEDDYEEICLELLLDALKKEKKKLILLMDNFGDLLEKFTLQERQRLREVLLTIPEIRIIAGSSRILEHTFSNDEPFHEFFKIVQLDGLNKKEVTALLKNLGEADEQPRIKQILKEEPARIESLRRLSGGVPRTMVLLYEIFIDEETGDSFKTLHSLVDRVSPLYKHRMDELKPNQQEIIEVIALNWDGMPVKEIARRTRMESNVVSAQLTQLEKNNIIDKVKTSTKNNFYRLSERFFNIWYIMRHGRKRDHRRVKWLVEFFRDWCTEDEIKARAVKHMDNLKRGTLDESHAFHITETLAQLLPPGEDQDSLISSAKDFFTKRNSRWVNSIIPSDMQLIQEAGQSIPKTNKTELALEIARKIRNAPLQSYIIFILKKIKTDRYSQYLLNKVFQSLDYILTTIYFVGQDLRALKTKEQGFLKLLGATESGRSKLLIVGLTLRSMEFYEKAELLFQHAKDFESQNMKAIWHSEIARLYQDHLHRFEKAEEHYLNAIKAGIQNDVFRLALLYHQDIKRYKDAEKYYLIDINNGSSKAMYNLAYLYEIDLDLPEAANKYFEMAREHNHPKAVSRKLLIDYTQRKKSSTDLKDIKDIKDLWELDQSHLTAFTAALVSLWYDEYKNAFVMTPHFMNEESLMEDGVKEFVGEFLRLLLAKKQYQFTHRLFEESTIDLKDRFKPIYYALMHFMRDEYPDEILKMGPELKETVDEIIAEVKQMAIDYA